MELEVTVQIDGSDVRAGTLYAHARKGVESASFRYDGRYLSRSRSFPLAPDMPLTDGSLHTQGEPMFRVFDVGDFVAAGSSLGGARPKASVIDERGALNIAKFPKADDMHQ